MRGEPGNRTPSPLTTRFIVSRGSGSTARTSGIASKSPATRTARRACREYRVSNQRPLSIDPAALPRRQGHAARHGSSGASGFSRSNNQLVRNGSSNNTLAMSARNTFAPHWESWSDTPRTPLAHAANMRPITSRDIRRSILAPRRLTREHITSARVESSCSTVTKRSTLPKRRREVGVPVTDKGPASKLDDMLHTGPHSGRLTCVRGQRVHEDPTGTALMQPLQDLARPIDAPVIYKREDQTSDGRQERPINTGP